MTDEQSAKKQEVLVDIYNLDLKNRKLIAKAIVTSFNEYKLNIADCKEQEYENQSSMISELLGVNTKNQLHCIILQL